jgi:hypothetical protein
LIREREEKEKGREEVKRKMRPKVIGKSTTRCHPVLPGTLCGAGFREILGTTQKVPPVPPEFVKERGVSGVVSNG